MKLNDEFQGMDVPTKCTKCGGSMHYEGVGEYRCVHCGWYDYDDYGKVRNYLESHQGATQIEVSNATGVPRARVKQMLLEDRIQISPGSAVFLTCSECGAAIRSGMYCSKCAASLAKNAQNKPHKNMSGYASPEGYSDGKLRYISKREP